MEVKVLNAEEVWQKPDGSMKLYMVSIEVNGQVYKVKTWNKTIAEDSLGKMVDVESYEKERGGKKEKFLKPAKKGGGFGPGRQALDRKLTALTVAKDVAIANASQKNGFVDIGDLLKSADSFYQWLNK